MIFLPKYQVYFVYTCSIHAAYYKCQNSPSSNYCLPNALHLSGLFTWWRHSVCGNIVAVRFWLNKFLACPPIQKMLECESDVGRIRGQGTKGANQFGRRRDWRFLSRHCCKSAFLSASRFRLDTFSSGLPCKSASFAAKFYAGHQFWSTRSFSGFWLVSSWVRAISHVVHKQKQGFICFNACSIGKVRSILNFKCQNLKVSSGFA